MSDEIQRTLNLFHEPGSVVELRLIGLKNNRFRPSNASGYFTDFDEAAELATRYEAERHPESICFTFNSINPRLLARSPELITEHLSKTTSDNDVIRRRWLLVDFDPDRPSGVSSTDDELEAARCVAQQARDWLIERHSFPEPIEAMSGNGWHLMFPIDLPNSPESKVMIENNLQAIAAHIGDGDSGVSVDTSVSNASRVAKLYGTMARKGYEMPGMPHRRSQIVHVPDSLQISNHGGETR